MPASPSATDRGRSSPVRRKAWARRSRGRWPSAGSTWCCSPGARPSSTTWPRRSAPTLASTPAPSPSTSPSLTPWRRSSTRPPGSRSGMLMYCAGADPNYQAVPRQPVEVAAGDGAPELHRARCRSATTSPARWWHAGRGGIVLVSSGAGLVGARNMVAYGATKAFDMVMAEALWAELHDQGVDVLALVLGVTDTPALRRVLARAREPAEPRRHDPDPGCGDARRGRGRRPRQPVERPDVVRGRACCARAPATWARCRAARRSG